MDIGLETTGAIRAMLQVDRVWSTDLPRGFSWWAHDVGQDVVASEPWTEGDIEMARIIVRTAVLRTPEPPANAPELLAEMNSVTTGGAFRLDGDGTLVHESSAVTNEPALGWVTRAEAVCAIVALTSGVRVARAYASRLGAEPLVTAHPTTGPRPWADDMLNMPAQLMIPQGEGGSFWADEAASFARAAEIVNHGAGFAADTSGEHGLWCEFGYGSDRSSFLVLAPTDAGGRTVPGLPPVGPDPEYGHGLLGWLVLPLSTSRREAAEAAGLLNEHEMATAPSSETIGAMHLGAWTTWGDDGSAAPAYRIFVPNLLAAAIGVENLAVHLWGRSLGASRLLLPDEPVIDGAGIAAMRLADAQRLLGESSRES